MARGSYVPQTTAIEICNSQLDRFKMALESAGYLLHMRLGTMLTSQGLVAMDDALIQCRLIEQHPCKCRVSDNLLNVWYLVPYPGSRR